MKKNRFILCMAILFYYAGYAQQSNQRGFDCDTPEEVVVGATGTGTNMIPFNPGYGYSYSQQIFEASEIGTGMGIIKSIAFRYIHTNSLTRTNQAIYLGLTSIDSFDNTDDWLPYSQLIKVFSGTITYDNSSEWLTINFDTPFIYEGGNLVVAYLDSNVSSVMTPNVFNWAVLSPLSKTLVYSGMVSADPTSPPTATNLMSYRNNVKFEICPVSFIWGFVKKQDSSPVKSGTVSLYEIQEGRYPLVETVSLDMSGLFRFNFVQKGDYLIKANPSDCSYGLPTYYGDEEFWESATPISIENEDAGNLIINVNPCQPCNGTSTISGFVYVDDGRKGLEPAEGVDVCIIKTVNITKTTVAGTTTNAAGYFGFTNVPAGNYTVKIDVPGVPTPHYSIGDIEEGEEITDIKITFDDYNSITKRVGSHASILVFPNPTTGELTIELRQAQLPNGELKINNVELYDVMGKKVSSNHLITTSSNHLINISHLSSGLYFLRIETETGIVTKKIIKN